MNGNDVARLREVGGALDGTQGRVRHTRLLVTAGQGNMKFGGGRGRGERRDARQYEAECSHDLSLTPKRLPVVNAPPTLSLFSTPLPPNSFVDGLNSIFLAVKEARAYAKSAILQAVKSMNDEKQQLWERFKQYYYEFPSLGLRTDLSRMRFPDDYFDRMAPRIAAAFREMDALEAGQIANQDEKRMVGHYWLRNPSLAPNASIREEIESTLRRIETFAAAVHSGVIRGQHGNFKNLLLIGIGGSSLGPQFVASALGHPKTNRMTSFFFDNTDSDGMERVLSSIGNELGRTLTIVISKSGGTKETRNGMLEAAASYRAAGLEFNRHAVSITRDKSDLYTHSMQGGWLENFPMWDWVGGRTSELSTVGLLPAALQGINIRSLLAGAKTCDELTRTKQVASNPAAQLALMWFHAGGGTGSKNMVVIPYRDRLELFSKYLQQLIMESIGKELDRNGVRVNQGISVFGNKGSTDQHSYVQQLRDGRNDFFVTFIEVLYSPNSSAFKVDGQSVSDDHLAGFFLGTRQALYEASRESLTITIEKVEESSVGMLIALFERAVGLYASIINVNAYHQPGVEAGKKAAESVILLQNAVVHFFKSRLGNCFTSKEISSCIGMPNEVEHVFKICERLSSDPSSGVTRQSGNCPTMAMYGSRS